MNEVEAYLGMIDKLPAASVANGELTKRDHFLLVELGGRFTVADLYDLVDDGAVAEPLKKAFNTRARLRRIQKSLEQFEAACMDWLTDRSRAPVFKYVFPDQLFIADTAYRRDLVEPLLGVIGASTLPRRQRQALVSCIGDLGSIPTWIRFLSLEGSRAIRSLRVGDSERLLAAYHKGRRSLDLDRRSPWSGELELQVAAIPASWLRQFDLQDRMTTLLSRFAMAGYTSVGHLSVLDPNARRFVRDVSDRDLVKLYSDVRRALTGLT